MARKFIQMGMTRSKRYANYKGGRKYVDAKEKGEKREKSKSHEGKEEKEVVSGIFKEVWERCKSHEGYQEMKKVFLKEQKEWLEVMSVGAQDEDETKAALTTSTRKSSRKRQDQPKSSEEEPSRITTENN